MVPGGTGVWHGWNEPCHKNKPSCFELRSGGPASLAWGFGLRGSWRNLGCRGLKLAVEFAGKRASLLPGGHVQAKMGSIGAAGARWTGSEA